MTIYKPLPESLILTPKQIQDFEHLHIALARMKDWLESHNYQNTTVEPVIIGKTSWLRRKEVMSLQYQRIYSLRTAFYLTGNVHYRNKDFAVNIDGQLLIGNFVSGINRRHHRQRPSNRATSKANWATAQYVGLKPVYIQSIVQSINKTTSNY